MEKFVDETAGERFNGCKLLGGERAETRMNALDLGEANFFCSLLQRDDGRSGVDGALALMEALDFGGDDRLGVNGLDAALFHVRGGDLLQVVDVVDEDAVELVQLRIDVARDGDIDEEHGPVAALVKEGLAVLGAEDGMRRAGGADDDVGAAGGVIEMLEFDDLGDNGAGKLLGHAAGALGGAIADENFAGALLHKMARGNLAHFACADEKDGAALKRAEDFAGEIDGHGCDGDGVGADAGFAARFFCGGERALQQVIELRGDGSGGAGHGEGFFDLAENLRLADNHGIEARGHAEEMADGIFIAVLVEVRRED